MNSNSEVIAMNLVLAAKFVFFTQLTDISLQNIDAMTLEIYKMLIAGFSI